MLSTLSTAKSRLAIPDLDVQYDDLLTTALTALSSRFDKYTSRTLARMANTTHEFAGDDTEIIPTCVPVESVSKFEVKSTEAEGWVQQSNADYVLHNSSLISLASRLGSSRHQGTYQQFGTLDLLQQWPPFFK